MYMLTGDNHSFFEVRVYMYIFVSMQGYLQIITSTLQIDLLQLFYFFLFCLYHVCYMLYMSVLKTMFYIHV